MGKVIAIVFVVIILLGLTLPLGIDWHQTFRPAALALSPAGAPPEAPFGGAPWILWLLYPIAILPERVGRAILFAISLLAFAYVAHKFTRKISLTAIFLVSPPVLHSLFDANLDILPLLGFILPPQIGLFLIAAKPQMGFVVALLWLYEAYKAKTIIRTFGPVSIALVVSILIYGFWPLIGIKIAQISGIWNLSFWPYSIPLGLGLLIWAIYKQKIRPAMIASPCLSPYVQLHTWSGALVALPARGMIFMVCALWTFIVLRLILLKMS